MKKEGILLIDKTSGCTSYDVVKHIKSKLSIKKIGHAGTLDPMATGLLIILIGKYTKHFNRFVNFDKEYEATLTLGVTTDTGDSQGRVINKVEVSSVQHDRIIEAFDAFLGETHQVPPMISALRFKGKRLYELARKGIQIPRKPRPIRIDKIEINSIYLPNIDFSVTCSKGTYVRTLAEDIGKHLGLGGHVSRIRRTQIGPFSVGDALGFNRLKALENIDESYIRSQ